MQVEEHRPAGPVTVALVALVVILGFHAVRVVMPLIGWYLRDVEHVGTFNLIPYALAPFLAAFLVPVLVRLAGARVAIWIAVGGLAVARLIEQVVGDPAADLWLSMAGVALFLWALPLVAALARATVAVGLLVGIAADTALKGATRTLDLSWYDTVWALFVVIVLCAAMVAALVLVTRDHPAPLWYDRSSARALLAVGPVLLFEWFVLQNQGWVASQTGWASEQALLLITVANVVAVWAALRPLPAAWAARAGGLTILAVGVVAFGLRGIGFGVLVFATIVAAGALLAAAVSSDAVSERSGATASNLAAGMLVLVLLALIYFVAIDRDLSGLTNRRTLLVAGVVAALGAAVVTTRRGVAPSSAPVGAVAATAVFVLVPLVLLGIDLADEDSPPSPPASVVVMSYNIHAAFDGTGTQNPQAIAAAIEASGADVVGLQEVARGWFLNGGTDLVTWLAHRLDMPYWAFAPAADPGFGNAILSRYPLEDVESEELPLGITPHQRSFIAADVDLGRSSFHLVNTHLQHVDDPSIPDEERERDLAPLHIRQLGTVLDGWDARPATVLTGDLNAQPGWAQIEYLLGEGFVDGLAAVDPADAWTSGYWDNDGVARWRIDWVVHTPDLTVIDGYVIRDETSDHHPVVVEFAVAG